MMIRPEGLPVLLGRPNRGQDGGHRGRTRGNYEDCSRVVGSFSRDLKRHRQVLRGQRKVAISFCEGFGALIE
jgi:hypothetical protein